LNLLADESFQACSVFALEVAQLLDLALDGLTLCAQTLLSLRVFGFSLLHDSRSLSMTLRDEFVAFLDTLTHVLFVEPASKLQEVVSILGIHHVTSGGGKRIHSYRAGRTTGSLQFRDSGFTRRKFLGQIIVFGQDATHFDDNFVKKIINLVLVIAFAKLGRLKALVDNVFSCQSHEKYLILVLGWDPAVI
jgi:hypothetical protein